MNTMLENYLCGIMASKEILRHFLSGVLCHDMGVSRGYLTLSETAREYI